MKRIKEFHDKIVKDPLYRNSLFLMMSSAVMTGFGFFFWTICSRYYGTYEVGMASTVISAMNLIVSFSGLGLGVALIRFLPKFKEKSNKINSCFTLAALTSVIISTVFLLFIHVFSPELLFIKKNLYYSLIFIVSVMVWVLFGLSESVFVSYRKAHFVLIKNAVFSVFKLLFPILFVSFGVFGIFGSWGLSSLVALIFAFGIMIKRFRYKPKLVIYDRILKKIFKFSFGNYLAGFLGTMPNLVLPLLITHHLSAENTAYFYVSFMIAGLLFVIPGAVSNSLFAEGSQDGNFKKNLKKSILIISLLLIPGIIFIILFGKYLLLLFGEAYATNGYSLLVVLALSSVFVAVKAVYSSYLNVKKKVFKLILINLIVGVIVLSLSLLFIDYGLMGVGMAWLIGQGSSLIVMGVVR